MRACAADICGKLFNYADRLHHRATMKKAALLAAGDSTRMMPLSANISKHLLPVAGEPLIFHNLKALRDAGIKETLIIYGYRGEDLQDAIDSVDWKPMRISCILQKERKGTADAARYAKEFALNDDIILMYGDVLSGPGTFKGLVERHRRSKRSLTMTVKSVNDPSAYGIVVVKKEKAVDLIEKPKPEQMVSNLVNAGIFAAGPEIWDAIDKTQPSSRGELEITDSIKMLIDQGKVGAYEIPSWWMDVGKPWDLLEANKLILNDATGYISGEVEEGAVLKGEVLVEKGATIRSGAYIEGPVYIGKGSTIGPNCYLRAHTSVGKQVKIGNAVEIKNSIIMDGTNVGHLSYVGDSVIGRKVNFGAGTITANLRHDNKTVKVSIKGKRIDSGRRKMGAVIGDNVKTGIGTLIAPGIVLHQGSRTGVGVIVDKDIEPEKLMLTNQPRKVVDVRQE